MDSSNGPASYWTQANALLRKNLTFQKRNVKTNIRLASSPIFICLLLVLIQGFVNQELDKPRYRCGCICVDQNGDGQCERQCGIEYSTLEQAASCPMPEPPQWSPLLQVPAPQYRAVTTDIISNSDLPNESCRITGTCPATILFTGNNRSLGETLARDMFTSSFNLNSTSDDVFTRLANIVLGSASMTEYNNYLDSAFFSDLPLYQVQSQCSSNAASSISIPIGSRTVEHGTFSS